MAHKPNKIILFTVTSAMNNRVAFECRQFAHIGTFSESPLSADVDKFYCSITSHIQFVCNSAE